MDDNMDYLSFKYIDAYGDSRRKSVCLKDDPELESFINERWLDGQRGLELEIIRRFDDVVQIQECVGWLDSVSRWIRVL